MNRYFDGISSFINDLTILDTHEHLLFSSAWESRRPIDAVAYIIHYCLRDFLSAGLSFADCERLRYGRELTVSEKFCLLKPYWHACKFSGFAQILNISVRDLYGIEEIGTCTIESLEQAYQRIFTHPRFKEVLRKKSKIHRALLDTAQAFQADRDYFLPVYRIDWLVLLQSRKHLVLLEQESGRTIVCFDDYLDACRLVLDKKRSAGTGVFKCALAYQRSLFFSESSYTQAKKSFQSFFQSVQNIPLEENVPPLGEEFQNYMMHFILDYMNLHGMVLQIHTGIQEGSGNILYHSNPIFLNSLFMKYPQVSFDLFHIGYPYQHELGALCKMFPNVYLNMCWAHSISPKSARDSLSEWLENVPLNKIFAFGGDCNFSDETYGHQVLARKHVALVLSQKMEDGLFTPSQAEEIAGDLFYGNAARLYHI